MQPSEKKDFKEGLHEIYTELFSNEVYLLLMDETATTTNIYKESKYKKYQDPIKVSGSVKIAPVKGQKDPQGFKLNATIKIPLYDLEVNNIDPTDYATMRKALLQYGTTKFEIRNVIPQTFVGDMFLVYEFDCEEKV